MSGWVETRIAVARAIVALLWVIVAWRLRELACRLIGDAVRWGTCPRCWRRATR